MNQSSEDTAKDESDRQFNPMWTAPAQFIKEMDQFLVQHPGDPNAYFARHQAWKRLGQLDLASADLDKSLAFEDHFTTHAARAGFCVSLAGTKKP